MKVVTYRANHRLIAKRYQFIFYTINCNKNAAQPGFITLLKLLSQFTTKI